MRETKLSAHDFILPLFVSEKLEHRRPIASMPGVFQLAPKEVSEEAQRAFDLGLQAVLLFGIPAAKDEGDPALVVELKGLGTTGWIYQFYRITEGGSEDRILGAQAQSKQKQGNRPRSPAL